MILKYRTHRGKEPNKCHVVNEPPTPSGQTIILFTGSKPFTFKPPEGHMNKGLSGCTHSDTIRWCLSYLIYRQLRCGPPLFSCGERLLLQSRRGQEVRPNITGSAQTCVLRRHNADRVSLDEIIFPLKHRDCEGGWGGLAFWGENVWYWCYVSEFFTELV